MRKSTSLTDNRFGLRGWSVIIYCIILNFIFAALTTDGLNLFPTAFAEQYGWDSNTLLAVATPAGIIGIIGGFIFARMVIKIKARNISGVTLILSGLLFIVMGQSQTLTTYFVSYVLISFVANGFGLAAMPVFMANWFPRKKGIALGWATMGAPLSTALFVSGFAVMMAKLGIKPSFLIFGIFVIIIGVVTFFWVKDNPADVGALPDNMDVPEGMEFSRDEEKSIFTIKTLLKDKDLWLIIVGFGMLWMVTVGVISQFVPRMVSVGHSQSEALMMMTISAIIAIPGSYFWGWLDTKIGTKKASCTYAASYIIALILLITAFNPVCVWIGCIFCGLGIGGLLNLLQSMVITVYGRKDFVFANSLVMPLASIIRMFAFILMGILLGISQGSYTLPYIVFIVIDIIGAVVLLFVTDKCKGRN